MMQGTRFLRASLLVLVVSFSVALGMFALRTLRRESPEDSVAATRGEQLFAGWAADYAENEIYTRTPIRLAFSRAFSRHFTRAAGSVEINFETGKVTVATEDFDAISEDSVYEVWLVDNVPGVHNSAAMDLGEGGDTILSLGALPPSGSLTTFVDLKELAGFEVDLAAVMRIFPEREPEFVIGGMQSIVFQLNRQARLAEDHSSTLTGLLDYWLGSPVFADPQPHMSHTPGNGDGNGNGNDDLITLGEDLFFNETFGGNGRTCGTCHRLNRDLTIDIDFIAGLPATDLLFIADFSSADQAVLGVNLPAFDPMNPSAPAFEDPVLMNARGLILENIEGFDVDLTTGDLLNPPVFRVPPSLFNLEFTAPYGYSACCADLRIFAMGAVVQHFPKTLLRIATSEGGTDFGFPTEGERLLAA